MVLHGRGIGSYIEGDQAWMTKTYERKRRRGLRDKTDLDSDELDKYEISGSQGGGRTNEKTYKIWQYPFPINQAVRRKKKIDIRKVKPELGEMSD